MKTNHNLSAAIGIIFSMLPPGIQPGSLNPFFLPDPPAFTACEDSSVSVLKNDSPVIPDSPGTDLPDKKEPEPGRQSPVEKKPKTEPAVQFRKVENRAFGSGESLQFEIGWKFIKAGSATMTIRDTVFQGRPCYVIKTAAVSSSTIDVIFKVRDSVISIVDREGLFPWKFEKHLREGNFKRDRYTRFDPYKNRVYLKRDTLEVPRYVQDILSSFYYVRTQPLVIGSYFDIDNLSDKTVYPLRILVHKKEKIKVPAGEFKCIVVEPVIRGEGIFNQKGRLRIWLTDDERKIPVLMKSEVFIGSVDAKLVKIRKPLKSQVE